MPSYKYKESYKIKNSDEAEMGSDLVLEFPNFNMFYKVDGTGTTQCGTEQNSICFQLFIPGYVQISNMPY